MDDLTARIIGMWVGAIAMGYQFGWVVGVGVFFTIMALLPIDKR